MVPLIRMTAPDDDAPTRAAAAQVVGLSRESTIVLDPEGRWFHGGEPVTHPGLARMFHKWIARAPDGRFILRSRPEARDWCYVTVRDAPYVVRAVRFDADRVTLVLSDESEEDLDVATLEQAPDNVLYCAVKAGTFRARFSRDAYLRLAERIEERGAEGFALRARGGFHPIRPIPSGSPLR